MDKEKKDKKKLTQEEKEQQLLVFITDLQKESKSLKPEETIEKLLDKIPKET